MANPSAGKIGMGFQFLIGDGASPEVFTPVVELFQLGGPDLSKDSVELTNTDSLNKFREFVPGLKSGGTLSISGNLIKASMDQMLAEYNKSGRTNYRVTVPADVAFQMDFEGFVTSFPPDVPIDDRMTFQASIQISGPVTIT